MNFKICFRHLVSLKMIPFEKIFKTVASLQYSVNNLGTKFLSACYSNLWLILSEFVILDVEDNFVFLCIIAE